MAAMAFVARTWAVTLLALSATRVVVASEDIPDDSAAIAEELAFGASGVHATTQNPMAYSLPSVFPCS